jgi:RNA polymerase sigma-70 factor, ECF subfamily
MEYTNLTDEALMSLIQEANKEALSELYKRYAQRLFRYFYRLNGHDEMLANDQTQDVFLKIIEKPKSFDTQRKFSTWVYTIASNKLKNQYRDAKSHSEEPLQYLVYQEDIEKNIDLKHYEKHLQRSLAMLEKSHQECFALRYFEELSIREIAEIQQCPEGTVKSRLHYTLKHCAKELAWLSEIL